MRLSKDDAHKVKGLQLTFLIEILKANFLSDKSARHLAVLQHH